MSFKTILAILITIGLTVFIVQNQDKATFTVLFGTLVLSKMGVMIAVAVSAFILGIIVASPGRKKQVMSYDEDEDDEEDDTPPRRRPDTLSDEDREYIS